jgi:diguanylate cyclase (GGDEF)-like protein
MDNAITIKELKRQITVLKKENEKLRQSAIIDELTQLYNRRGFNQLGSYFFNKKPKNKIDQRKKIKQNVMLFLDLDDFKLVNDNYGHLKGDKVLKAFASFLKKKTRKEDLIVRFGGEEFLIILNNINLKEGIKKANTLLNDIRKQKFSKIKITCCIGIIDLSKEYNISKAIKKADKLMYQAKKNGKNTICY